MPRLIFLLFFFLLTSVYAHSGFTTLAWQESLGDYTLTVLEDFHTSGREPSQLFIQLSQGDKAAPDTTQVTAIIELEDKLTYEGEVPFVASGSEDGKTFYRGYLLTLELEEKGTYQIEVTASGPLGRETAYYFVQSQQEAFSVLEMLPSLLILLISLGGAALLFIPIKRKDAPNEAKDLSSFKPFHAS